MANAHTEGFLRNRLWIFSLLVVLALLIWSSVTLQGIFFDSVVAISFFTENHPFAGVMFFVFLTALSSLLSPFSSIPFVPFSVAIFGGFPTIVFLMLGWMTGAIISYFLGVTVDKAFLQNLTSVEKINYYKDKISAHSHFYTIMVFRLALPAEITGYSLGILRYNFGKYLLAVFLSEIPFAVLAVFSSQAFLEKNFIIFSGLVLLTAGLVLYLLKVFKRKFSEHQ